LTAAPLDPQLLALLACPICKGPLTAAADATKLSCPPCRRDYPVEGGIPNLVP
jgi:uncharacterized protein YbaR (Trm112 family)